MSQASQSTSPSQGAFGGRIRAMRRSVNMTLQQLADVSGVSVGFLSLVERDKATPSLGSLASIAAALGVDVEVFVSTPKPSQSVTRAGERQPFFIGDRSLRYEQISTPLQGGSLTSLIIEMPQGYMSELTSRVGEELIMVLEGQVSHTLGDASLVLNPGDSMHFMGDTPHSFGNHGAGVARMIWVGTSPHLVNLRKSYYNDKDAAP